MRSVTSSVKVPEKKVDPTNSSQLISTGNSTDKQSGQLEKMLIVAFAANETTQQQTTSTTDRSTTKVTGQKATKVNKTTTTTKDVKVLVPGEEIGRFSPMYNPNTLTINTSNQFDPGKEALAGDVTKKFKYQNPRTLSVELFFDGTKVSPTSNPTFSNNQFVNHNVTGSNTVKNENTEDKTMYDAITFFFNTCVNVTSEGHAPPFVALTWGAMIFKGVIESANTTYSLFDNTGTPIRAKVSLSLKEHFSSEEVKADLKLQSPDLTKFRTVVAGDTLHTIAANEYGDPYLYLQLAEANNLTNFRVLKPGTKLILPPIEKIKTSK
jgi:Contractile injection system tube protein/LysM domain